MSYLVKLVRDRVAETLGGDGAITYKPVGDHDAYVSLLRRKLIEEAAEYMANPSVEELADVLEVVEALAWIDRGVTLADVRDAANAKYAQRGGFMHGMGMYATHPVDRAARPNTETGSGGR